MTLKEKRKKYKLLKVLDNSSSVYERVPSKIGEILPIKEMVRYKGKIMIEDGKYGDMWYESEIEYLETQDNPNSSILIKK